MTFSPIIMAAALLAAAPVAAAHPDHGSLLTGTLKEVAEDSITLEFRDTATLQLRRVKILVNEETKLRVVKEPIDSLEGRIGTYAAVAVSHEEDFRGDVTYTAREIRFEKPKNKEK